MNKMQQPLSQKHYLFTLLLIFEAVPNSSANIFATREIWSFGGMIKEIILVPFLRENDKNNMYKFIILRENNSLGSMNL